MDAQATVKAVAHKNDPALAVETIQIESFSGNRFVSGITPTERDISEKSNYKEPVAVIGMSGVFPGSGDLEAFWKHLEDGDDLISEIPSDRWDWKAYYGDPKKESNKTNIKWGGFIDSIFNPWFAGLVEALKWVAVLLTCVSGGMYLWRNRQLYLSDL